ncbi:hypothetical protein [Streptomyces erythrochromogenes]|uniref:hypothetical protein n=1 Tax=Streptomyces erythrochromogenes TaxID=285574 RepID=UPI0037D79526
MKDAKAGPALLSTLKQRDWPPTQHAFGTSVPDCQWYFLGAEELPPPIRELLKDLISRDTAPARSNVRPTS